MKSFYKLYNTQRGKEGGYARGIFTKPVAHFQPAEFYYNSSHRYRCRPLLVRFILIPYRFLSYKVGIREVRR